MNVCSQHLWWPTCLLVAFIWLGEIGRFEWYIFTRNKIVQLTFWPLPQFSMGKVLWFMLFLHWIFSLLSLKIEKVCPGQGEFLLWRGSFLSFLVVHFGFSPSPAKKKKRIIFFFFFCLFVINKQLKQSKYLIFYFWKAFRILK